ncbi:MAG: DMT family transporter [Crocinitomicaceae bacterium]|nr:DMT family transporter [Crocinitomicaceae bacterium]|tara:strand:- start:200 stop:1066 length:867 start_codon:yes stop_codon:yes gene_type:complete
MIALLLSVLSSSLIFVIFKLFARFKIDTFQAIVVNYFMAFIIGVVLYGDTWNERIMQNTSWVPFVIICAFMFIGLFLIMGKSSQLNGVASTSVAVKMSMAVSLLLMIISYGESINTLKITGIALAFIGVYLVSSTKGTKLSSSHKWMLTVLFIASGGFDFLLNYIQNNHLTDLSPALFSAIGLGLAGAIGLALLLVQALRGKVEFELKNIAGGIVLGIPNFFSIYLLLLSYKTTGWTDSTVLAITNVSVVLLSAMMGFVFFKEKATRMKLLGLLTAVLAIVALYLAIN